MLAAATLAAAALATAEAAEVYGAKTCRSGGGSGGVWRYLCRRRCPSDSFSTKTRRWRDRRRWWRVSVGGSSYTIHSLNASKVVVQIFRVQVFAAPSRTVALRESGWLAGGLHGAW